MQQVLQRHAFVRPQVGDRRAPGVGPVHHELFGQVGVVLDEADRRHHLRDAGNRTLIEGLFLPQDLAGLGVVDDRGFRADVGDNRPGRVGLEPGLGQIRHRAGPRQARPASPGGRRRVARFGPCGALRRGSRPAGSRLGSQERLALGRRSDAGLLAWGRLRSRLRQRIERRHGQHGRGDARRPEQGRRLSPSTHRHAGSPYQQVAQALGGRVYQNPPIAPTKKSAVFRYREVSA